MMSPKRRNALSRCRYYRTAALLLATVLLSLLLLAPAAAESVSTVRVAYVYSPSCSMCAHAGPVVRSAVNDAKSSGADVQYAEYSINSKEGVALAERYGLGTVPAVVVGDRAIRFEDFNGDPAKLGSLLKRYIEEPGASSGEDHVVMGPETYASQLKELPISAVFLSGLVAGINPCLLAIMAFVSAMALSMRGRRLDIVFQLLAFCGGLLTIYLLMGIGFLNMIERLPSLTAVLKAGIVLLLFVLAGFAFYEAYRLKTDPDRQSLFKAFLDRYKPLYRRYGLAANFGLGGAFGLIKMPCVGGIYVAILGAIVESGGAQGGLLYLTAYNLGVVLPVLALGALLVFGLSPGQVDEFRKRHRIKLKLFTGLILAAMAAGFVLNVL